MHKAACVLAETPLTNTGCVQASSAVAVAEKYVFHHVTRSIPWSIGNCPLPHDFSSPSPTYSPKLLFCRRATTPPPHLFQVHPTPLPSPVGSHLRQRILLNLSPVVARQPHDPIHFKSTLRLSPDPSPDRRTTTSSPIQLPPPLGITICLFRLQDLSPCPPPRIPCRRATTPRPHRPDHPTVSITAGLRSTRENLLTTSIPPFPLVTHHCDHYHPKPGSGRCAITLTRTHQLLSQYPGITADPPHVLRFPTASTFLGFLTFPTPSTVFYLLTTSSQNLSTGLHHPVQVLL
ncbi:hypothetical protein PGT21_000451 [Puccinia graminis f. sp. tritici]|uniref:Uncharacterized protein n=1 Tax=Puccinia graminis f. sp. tritici TaxID=56615 RepID=A0A5B0P9E1_PUCGR|nr:hypothetical protein PGT21_000451 [Puccinia graminis f. sp. tritici]